MSRREDRSSDAKRHRSRFDREPSPKRSRRDGKPETERAPNDSDDRLDRVQKHRRRLQDVLPLEAPPLRDSKMETGTMNKEDESSGNQGGTKHSADPTNKIPRSTSYFQHDDRGSIGQNGRSFGRRTDKEHEWRKDMNGKQNDRADNTTEASNTQRKDERPKDSRETDRAWRHDRYFEVEANPKPKRRPSFSEQKLPREPEKHNKAAVDFMTQKPQDHALETGRRDVRQHISRYPEKRERPFSGERRFNRGGTARDSFSSLDRNGAGNRYGGRDRFVSGQGPRSSGGGVDKWKHDLYNDANRSPTPKNEEDQISKIEALLAS